MPTSIEMEQVLDKMLSTGVSIPPLPGVAHELISIARQPVDKIEVKKIVELTEKDPGLTARLLRMANSSYYGVSGEVISLRHAIMIIGLMETINTLYFHVITKHIPVFPPLPGFNADGYWLNSWACATASKMLGRPSLHITALPGELYLAGLLHGIGKVVLAIKRQEKFAHSLQFAIDRQVPLRIAESEYLGYSDSELGAALLSTWNLPATIRSAVEHMHDPSLAPPEHAHIAGAIQLGYLITHQAQIGQSGSPVEMDISQAWLCCQKDSPLSNESIRQPVIDEIIATLNKKAGMISQTVLSDSTAQAEGDAGDGKKEAAALPKAPKLRKSNLLDKLADFFRSLFGK